MKSFFDDLSVTVRNFHAKFYVRIIQKNVRINSEKFYAFFTIILFYNKIFRIFYNNHKELPGAFCVLDDYYNNHG